MTGITDQGTPTGRTDLAAMLDAREAVARRFVELLRDLDEADGERPVPGLSWTIGDTAAHMLTVLRRGTGDNRRADSLAGLAELNELGLEEVETRSPGRLAELIEVEAETLGTLLGGLDPEQASGIEVELHAGVRADLPSALSYILCDLLAHGYDIATAADRPWDIDAAHAALDLHAMFPLLEPWLIEAVREGPKQRLVISFPGETEAILVEAGDRSYRAQDVDRSGAAEAHEVDPVDTFLALCGRREAQHAVVAQLASWFQPV